MAASRGYRVIQRARLLDSGTVTGVHRRRARTIPVRRDVSGDRLRITLLRGCGPQIKLIRAGVVTYDRPPVAEMVE
jgi:hypothetical protein